MMCRRVACLVFCLATCALASRSFLESQGCELGAVPEDKSGGLSFHYPRRGITPDNPDGDVGTANCTVGMMVRCNQTVSRARLSGRSWFMSQDKAFFGQGYNPRIFQTFNVQCPEGQFLQLALQGRLRAGDCTSGRPNSLSVDTSRGLINEVCRNNVFETSYLYNDGRGIFLEDGKARVDFCTNEDELDMDRGFVMRATCIDPTLLYNGPGCVSYDFFLDWDPDFVQSINRQFSMVNTTVVPHKRSAEEEANMYENVRQKMEQLKRAELEDVERKRNSVRDRMLSRTKRGVRYFFNFDNGTRITYINNILRFQFANGTVRTFFVHCLTAFNDLYGTRVYTTNATRQIGDTTGATTITFTGEGYVDITTTGARRTRQALLKWTPRRPFETFLENDVIQQQIAQRIYDYIYNNWVEPYPIIDDILVEGMDPQPFPFFGPESEFFPDRVRTRNQIRLIYPDITKGSVCREAIRFGDAPLESARVDQRLVKFCAFFQHACEPLLATACREVIRLDPYGVNPLSRMMMGGGD